MRQCSDLIVYLIHVHGIWYAMARGINTGWYQDDTVLLNFLPAIA